MNMGRVFFRRMAAAGKTFSSLLGNRGLSPPTSVRQLCSNAPVLYEMPPLSERLSRIQRHGLVAMTEPFVRDQATGNDKAKDQSFRVQNYEVKFYRPAEFGISAVFGYGRVRSRRLAAEIGCFGYYPLSRMTESQRQFIKDALNDACTAYEEPQRAAGAALQKEILLNIKRLKDIGCYRGTRHILRLPCNGQRTRTNARTRKRMGPLN